MPLKENPAPLLGGKADQAAKWETVGASVTERC